MKEYKVYRADTVKGVNISKFTPNGKATNDRIYVTFSEVEAVAWGIFLMVNYGHDCGCLYEITVKKFHSPNGKNIHPSAFMGIEDIPMREGWIYEDDIVDIRRI